MPHYNPEKQSAEPDTFKLICSKFEEVAHLMLSHADIMREFNSVTDKLKEKAMAKSASNPRIGRVIMPEVGWVYSRITKKTYAVTDTGPSSATGGNVVGGVPVQDSPDQRGPGPTPTKRKGYRGPGKGGKKKKEGQSGTNNADNDARGSQPLSMGDIGISGIRNPTLRLVQTNTDSTQAGRGEPHDFRSLGQFMRLDIGRGAR